MSLRCSLLGHSYGEAEIERDREEQGSEVVVTVREFEECERCGNQNVLSENKEVTALESPAPDLESAESDADLADSGADAGAGVDASPGAAADAGPAGTAGAASNGGSEADAGVGGDDAEIISDSPSSDASEVGSVGGGSPDDDFEEPEVTADDDGVILDDDGAEIGDDGRNPGEWPEVETTHPAEADDGGQAPWPEVGQEDEGFDAEPDGESVEVDFGGGLTPESAPGVAEDETEEVEFVNAEGDALRAREESRRDPTPELSSGISAGAEAPSLSGPAEDPAVDAEFVCPECDYREPVAGSSLRAGDICPECARGYLAQE